MIKRAVGQVTNTKNSRCKPHWWNHFHKTAVIVKACQLTETIPASVTRLVSIFEGEIALRCTAALKVSDCKLALLLILHTRSSAFISSFPSTQGQFKTNNYCKYVMHKHWGWIDGWLIQQIPPSIPALETEVPGSLKWPFQSLPQISGQLQESYVIFKLSVVTKAFYVCFPGYRTLLNSWKTMTAL